MTDLPEAARRALAALDDLISNTTDPGVEALGARHELSTALINAAPSAPADRAELDRLRAENERMRHELEVMYGGAFDSLENAPADRAAVLREAANGLAALGPLDSLVSAPAAWTEAIETLRRMADQIAEDELRPKAAAALSADCNCDPAPLDLGDGTYSHWAGCPIADAQQAADEAQQAGVHPTDTFAAASCPYGKGPGDGSGCIKPAGHDGDHVVTAGVPVMPCSRAVLQQPHLPYSWWPQPGMAYVHCPGATTETQQTGEGR
ncbi:hypothetical protein [Streptomyces sp. NPDC056105]|uniref:hypothetical protein n=1 Tax=Streptomyces sp. NPDC056105 TaxID=3345714 RepID=UPI0035D896C2